MKATKKLTAVLLALVMVLTLAACGGGGDGGGTIVATGTPEQIAAVEESYTGQFLKKMLL